MKIKKEIEFVKAEWPNYNFGDARISEDGLEAIVPAWDDEWGGVARFWTQPNGEIQWEWTL